MSKTIEYGYQILEDTDSPHEVVSVFNHNVRKIAGHRHRGEDSPPLEAASFRGPTRFISADAWQGGDLANGVLYSATVDATAGEGDVDLNLETPSFFVTDTETNRLEPVLLDYEVVSANELIVRTNTPTGITIRFE